MVKGHTDIVTSVNFSPDGRYTITGTIDGSIRMYLTKNLKLVKK